MQDGEPLTENISALNLDKATEDAAGVIKIIQDIPKEKEPEEKEPEENITSLLEKVISAVRNHKVDRGELQNFVYDLSDTYNYSTKVGGKGSKKVKHKRVHSARARNSSLRGRNAAMRRHTHRGNGRSNAWVV